MTMGEKILAMRKARGWSQEELAEQVGVTRQAVSRWESGAVKPDTDKVIAICDLFGVSADYLIRDNYNAVPEPEQPDAVKQTTAIGDAVRAMTLKQWLFLGAAVMGALMLIVLRFVYIFKDTNYVYYGLYSSCQGYQAFIRMEELLLLHYGSWICVLAWPVRYGFRWFRRELSRSVNGNG